jgi:hypothetical protein
VIFGQVEGLGSGIFLHPIHAWTQDSARTCANPAKQVQHQGFAYVCPKSLHQGLASVTLTPCRHQCFACTQSEPPGLEVLELACVLGLAGVPGGGGL